MMDFTLREWVRMARQYGTIAQAAVSAQAAESGVSEEVIRATMTHHLHCMQEAIRNGLDEKLRSVTGLTGGQAALMLRYYQQGNALCGSLLGKAEVYALATAECNACMGKIVAAPTAGACGILPGAIIAMMEEKGVTEAQAVEALFVAAAVEPALRVTHDQIQYQGHGHERQGAHQDQFHIPAADAAVDDAADAASAH